MQVGKDFYKRLQARCLVIGDGVRLAKGSHDELGFLQLVASHAGKEVMFDLIVQPSIPKISNGVSIHVAGGQHLAMQEIPGVLILKHRHTFMIGRENGPQVQSGQRLVNTYKKEGLPEPEAPDDEGQVEHNVSQQQNPFEPVEPDLLVL